MVFDLLALGVVIAPTVPVAIELVPIRPSMTASFARMTVRPDGSYEFRGPNGTPRVARASHRTIAAQTIGFYLSGSSGSDPAGGFTSRATGEHADVSPPGWAVLVILAFWIGVWIAGLRFLRGRKRY